MSTIGIALYYLFDILTWVVIIKSIMTWIPGLMESDTGRSIYNLLEKAIYPIEGPIRNVVYNYSSGPIDWTPMVTLLVLMLLSRVSLAIFL